MTLLSFISQYLPSLFLPSPLVVFLHLNKTAGTSLRLIVERNYLPDERIFIYPSGCSGLQNCLNSMAELRTLSRSRALKLKIIMGHMRFAPDMMPSNREVRYVTFLRDPVERVLSVYYHHKTKPQEPLYKLFNQKGFDILDFLESPPAAINSTIHPADNRMTRAICGRDIAPWKVCQEDLELAIYNLHHHFDHVLLTEYFNEGIRILSRHYKWRYAKVIKANATKIKPNRSDIPNDTIRKITLFNKWDVALYEYVKNNYKNMNIIS